MLEKPEIKREFAEQPNEVRVMTVHAAKGLEAPIVFLVDKSSEALSSGHEPALFEWGSNDAEPAKRGYLWVPAAVNRGDISAKSRALIKDLAEQEYRRLLYVGMTRAEDRLIVCGYQTSKSVRDPNWHNMVSSALDGELEKIEPLADDVVAYRWQSPNLFSKKPQAEGAISKPAAADKAEPLPGWLNHRLPREKALPRPLNPSGAQAVIDENLLKETVAPSLVAQTEEEPGYARQFGTLVHRLLQVWPDLDPADRKIQCISYASRTLPELSEAAAERLVERLETIVTSPALAAFFDPRTSRAEVPVMGRIDLASGPRPVSGVIDRVAVLEDRIMLLDYKTGRHVPETKADIPQDYLTQMALYRALVARLYPDRPVSATLVWTQAADGTKVFELQSDSLDEAFRELAAL